MEWVQLRSRMWQANGDDVRRERRRSAKSSSHTKLDTSKHYHVHPHDTQVAWLALSAFDTLNNRQSSRVVKQSRKLFIFAFSCCCCFSSSFYQSAHSLSCGASQKNSSWLGKFIREVYSTREKMCVSHTETTALGGSEWERHGVFVS